MPWDPMGPVTMIHCSSPTLHQHFSISGLRTRISLWKTFSGPLKTVCFLPHHRPSSFLYEETATCHSSLPPSNPFPTPLGRQAKSWCPPPPANASLSRSACPRLAASRLLVPARSYPGLMCSVDLAASREMAILDSQRPMESASVGGKRRRQLGGSTVS